MKTKQARESGKRIAERVHAGEIESAYALLAPVLAERTPFRLLGLIGEAIGAGPLEPVDAFLDRIASERRPGLTLAPEAGSERLRRVINKAIPDDLLFEAMEQAREMGWSLQARGMNAARSWLIGLSPLTMSS